MTGFFALLGHLLGDYILQNDWQAKHKATPFPKAPPKIVMDLIREQSWVGPSRSRQADLDAWLDECRKWWIGHLACTIHCALYTLCTWACTFWWMPWWGLVVCFATHWIIDRFALAGRWMRNISGQRFFASPEHKMFPWSVVMVDNIFHLATLGLIAAMAGVVC